MHSLANPHSAREDATLVDQTDASHTPVLHQDCCLVQIYPTDIVDGMMLLERAMVTVGRDLQCDLQLEDSSVSRRHAQFHREGDTFEIADLDSTNGTLVNGEPIRKRLLSSGDCIKIGCYLFKFLSAGSIETAYHETVYSAMTIDALTGAFNKTFLLDNLQREIARSHRHDRPLAVVMTDIDRFKSVNDTHGHLVGDEVLKEFGQRLSGICQDDALFARYGGEEFSLVLPEASADEAVALAERCREAIAETPFQTAAGPLAITASFGVEMATASNDETPKSIIGRADELLYQAKKAGRNRVVGPA